MSVHKIQPNAGYKGAGPAWGAVNAQGEVVSLVYMRDHRGCDLELVEHPDRRYRSGFRIQSRPKLTRPSRDQVFREHRQAALAKLRAIAGQEGTVVSGRASCWEFIVG